MKYTVKDSRTGQTVATYQDRVRAGRRADRMDNEYGAYRYRVEAECETMAEVEAQYTASTGRTFQRA